VTIHHIDSADLPGALPEFVGAASVIALVPAGDPAARAPDTAWAVARAAAAQGRRTLLVDCFVDAPRLHTVVGAPNDDGIVDAFEYGASLNRIARQQPEDKLFFIPAGSYAADAGALMANRRWQRLAAGFRHEGALLLLFLPASAVPVIAGETDGTLVLAPAGFRLEGDAAGDLAGIAESAAPVVVVRAAAPVPAEGTEGTEGDAPADRPARPVMRRTRPPFAELESVRQGGEKRRTRRAVIYAGVVVVAGVLGVTAVRPEWILPGGDADEERTAAAASRPAQRLDSLPWVVQVSAWDNLGRAQEAADTLEARGASAFVTPTSLPRRVSFRVQAGPFPSQAAADSLLDSLRARGLADPVGSISVEQPLSLVLGGRALSAGEARLQRDSLRALGIPTFVLGQRGNRFRLLAGAFESAPATAFLDSLLLTIGRARRLGPRVGFVP
jgi:hypothetical protein